MACVGILLLDSASLYYRAYFALPDSITSPDGQPVNAVRGFLDTMASLARDREPATVVACWDDDWRPQWRVDLVPTYKTHRVLDEGTSDELSVEEVPDTLAPQIDVIAELLEIAGIPRIGAVECEADDVVATLALRSRSPVDIASGDRDLLQLVSDRVTLLYTGGTSASRGGRPYAPMDPDLVRAQYGVDPERYADLSILRGDPSDGLPGVRGIGAKTAAALVTAFGGIDGILRAAREPGSPRPMTPTLRDRLLDAEGTLRDLDRVVRLRARPGVPPMPRMSLDPEAALVAARRYGVEPSMRRLMDVLA